MSTKIDQGLMAEGRLIWPLRELSQVTGMSIAFWKKTISKGEIPASKAGNRTVIFDSDLREYLMKRRQVQGRAA